MKENRQVIWESYAIDIESRINKVFLSLYLLMKMNFTLQHSAEKVITKAYLKIKSFN